MWVNTEHWFNSHRSTNNVECRWYSITFSLSKMSIGSIQMLKWSIISITSSNMSPWWIKHVFQCFLIFVSLRSFRYFIIFKDVRIYRYFFIFEDLENLRWCVNFECYIIFYFFYWNILYHIIVILEFQWRLKRHLILVWYRQCCSIVNFIKCYSRQNIYFSAGFWIGYNSLFELFCNRENSSVMDRIIM